MTQVVHATNLVVKLRVHYKVEIFVDLLDLREVLLLHAAPCLALGAVLSWVREEHLVDDDVVNVNVLLGELDGQTLSLVHGKELGDAHCHERRLCFVLKLLIHFLNLCLHAIDAIKEALLCVLSAIGTGLVRIHHVLHLLEHTSKLVFQLNQLHKALFKDVGEVEQT